MLSSQGKYDDVLLADFGHGGQSQRNPVNYAIHIIVPKGVLSVLSVHSLFPHSHFPIERWSDTIGERLGLGSTALRALWCTGGKTPNLCPRTMEYMMNGWLTAGGATGNVWGSWRQTLELKDRECGASVSSNTNWDSDASVNIDFIF